MSSARGNKLKKVSSTGSPENAFQGSGATKSPSPARGTKRAASAAARLTPTINTLDLIHQVEGLARGKVLIVGDLMLDEYLTGDAERISPEAPVPVVLVENEKQLVGGAGNVARNITSLEGRAVLVGVRGRDAAGEQLAACLEREGVEAFILPLEKRPTTTKTRVLARGQQVLRIDREDPSPLEQADASALLHNLERLLPDCGAVVVSDYGKGMITSAFMGALLALVHKQKRPLPVLVDPKPQNIAAYAGVTLLTPNAKETREASGLPVKTTEEILRAGRAIMERLCCPHLITTLGAKGMAVFQSRNEVWHIPTTARRVFDVTGAGDTVIAVTALALATGVPLLPACVLANHAAGIVVGEVGAATATPNQVAEALATLPGTPVERWA